MVKLFTQEFRDIVLGLSDGLTVSDNLKRLLNFYLKILIIKKTFGFVLNVFNL